MKILYIPLNTAIPEEDDFYIALVKAGHEVLWFWNHEIENQNWGSLDVIHLQSGAISSKTLKIIIRYIPKLITQWSGDYRPEPMEMISQYEGLVDITFLAAYTPELYPNQNVKWLPHGVADWQFREVNPDAEGIVMIANNYPQFPGGKEREEMHKLLSQRDDYVCYGSGFEGSKGYVPYRETPDIYNKFRFAVGCNIYNDVDRYFSNRPLAAMAAGCCFCLRGVPRLHEAFDEYWSYENNGDFLDMIRAFNLPGISDHYAKTMQLHVREKFHYDNIVKMWEDEL